jgi:hypothetical protein
MVNSIWRKTWREDYDRVLCAMSNQERLALRRWSLSSPRGRQVFVRAAARLALDIEYDAYIMEEAVVRLDPDTDGGLGRSRLN